MHYGIYEKPNKLYAFGDIHGDYGLLRVLLIDCARVMDDDDNWIGNDSVVVFVGDLVDRSRVGCILENTQLEDGTIVKRGVGEIVDEELHIFKLIAKLNEQSHAYGGGGFILPLFGNHEIMNFSKQVHNFSSEFCLHHDHQRSEEHFNSYDNMNNGSTHHGRHSRFKPRNNTHIGDIHQAVLDCYKYIGPINMICKFGEWIFVHGGIVKRFLKTFNIDLLENIDTPHLKQNLKQNRGEKTIQILNYIVDAKFNNLPLEGTYANHLENIWKDINTEDGPVWTRRWGQDCCDAEGSDCAELKSTLLYMFGQTNENNKPYKLGVAHCTQINRGPSRGGNIYTYNYFTKPCVIEEKISKYCNVCNRNRDNIVRARDSERYPGITFDCDETLWRLDAAMSRGFDFANTTDDDDMMNARRPQGLLIDNSSQTERRCVIKANYNLNRNN